MKKPFTLVTAISLCLFMTLGMETHLAAQTGNNKTIEGIWSGGLEIPGAAVLRVAVTVSKNDDGSLKAALRIIDQNTGDIPCDEVKYENDLVIFRISNLGIEIEGTVDSENDTIISEFRQRGGKLNLFLKRVDEMPAVNRPQTPKKPYPYSEEEVTYENKNAGIKLAGTLTYPRSGGPFPAVILLTGSGQQTRDEEIYGHKLFLVLADYLTRQGIAVLRADDRGIGGSTGNFDQSTTGDFAEDALAGIEYLKNRKEINPGQIGLIGHSEGGMIAPIATVKSPDVAFIVMLAGPGKGFGNLVIYQRAQHFKSIGMSDEDIALQSNWYKSIYAVSGQDIDNDAAEKKIRELFNRLSDEDKKRLGWTEGRLNDEMPGLLRPWWRYAMAYDSRATLMQVKCPVLAVIGEKDTQVPSKENLPAIEEALKAGGNNNFLVKELPGLNHIFQTADTGSEYEYGKIEETMSPDAMKLIADWIKARVKDLSKSSQVR